MRTLPLVPFIRERLLALEEEQQESLRLCGRSYIRDYLEYICGNEIPILLLRHLVKHLFKTVSTIPQVYSLIAAGSCYRRHISVCANVGVV